jgi:hypothetical protein
MFENLDFEKLLRPVPKFIITGSTFSQREELKAWGCFYDKEHKVWVIECERDSLEFKTICRLENIKINEVMNV